MRLLAIDTAAEACAVGVTDGARTILRSEDVGRGHAERLMPMIADAMREAGLAYDGLDRVAVTVGPGSFTGVRVGIAAARGLALVTGKPAIGVTTLAVHAAEARALMGPRVVLAVIAAGRGDAYGAVFATDGSVIRPPVAGSGQVFAALLQGDMILAGSGADLVIAALPMDGAPPVAHRRASVDIATFCRLAAEAHETGEPPRPLYLRPPDAKPQEGARVPRR